MPLNIIRQDITKTSCDVIVNAMNRHTSCAFGVSKAILDAAGEELLDCIPDFIEVGEVLVTPAFRLPCKYLLHVVGPVWRGGTYLEKETLALCYRNVLEKAAALGANSVALPLISSGSRGFPKEYVLTIAVDTIAEFLEENEMDVILVVYDKNSYSIGKELFGDIVEYIGDNYVDENDRRESRRFESAYRAPARRPVADGASYCASEEPPFEFFSASVSLSRHEKKQAPPKPTHPQTEDDEFSDLKELLEQTDDTFAVTLLKLIDAKNMTDVACYKKANVSRQTWHKIISDDSYKPSKTTVIAFAIALELTLKQTKALLETVGFALSTSSKFDIIIGYFISHGKYDIYKINNALFFFDQALLGV